MEEPGGLQSMGSQRAGHDGNDTATHAHSQLGKYSPEQMIPERLRCLLEETGQGPLRTQGKGQAPFPAVATVHPPWLEVKAHLTWHSDPGCFLMQAGGHAALAAFLITHRQAVGGHNRWKQ